MNKAKIAFLISYRKPRYMRALTLINALQNNPNIELFDIFNTSKGLTGYIQTLLKALIIEIREKPPIWIINFRGHEIYWFVRLLIGKKKKILFDEFVSPYDSFVNESKQLKPNSILANLIFRIEKSILNNADIILTDTISQSNYYRKLFDIPSVKTKSICMGCDEQIFNPINTELSPYDVSDDFIVFTYATFLPLHGMDVILKAANILRNLPIKFFIAGGNGKALKEFLYEKERLSLTNIIQEKWIETNALPAYIHGADLCLGGPFGNTEQGKRVITGKTIQFLACANATVIGKGYETSQFIDKENCLIAQQGDPQSLASAIQWAHDHQTKLLNIGSNGRTLYEKMFSRKIISKKLIALISEM